MGRQREAEGQLPSPITGTVLIYLFWLKKRTKKLRIAFGLTHKLSSLWACVCVILSAPLLPEGRGWLRHLFLLGKQPLHGLGGATPLLPTC